MSDDTVEWGSPRARGRWFDRLLAPFGRRQARVTAAAAAGLGFALMLAAELLPWLRLGRITVPEDLQTTRDFALAQLNTLLVIGYHLSLAGVLALTAIAVLGRPANRRLFGAAGVGWAAGHLVLLTGIYASVRRGGEFGELVDGQSELPMSIGSGLYCAVGGLALLTVATVLVGWLPEARDTPVRADEAEAVDDLLDPRVAGEPMDLSVSAIPPK